MGPGFSGISEICSHFYHLVQPGFRGMKSHLLVNEGTDFRGSSDISLFGHKTLA